MAKARAVGLGVIAILAAVIVVGGGGYYFYQQQNYVITDNASVSATLVPLDSPTGGRLVTWRAATGNAVSQGQVIGRIEGLTGTTQVVSPRSGNIVQNDAAVDEIVVPGQPLAYELNPNRIRIVANVDDSQIGNVAVGKKVDITIDAYPGTKFTGTVTQIGSATAVLTEGVPNTNLSQNFQHIVQRIPVYISIPGTEGKTLYPGLSAVVAIHRN